MEEKEDLELEIDYYEENDNEENLEDVIRSDDDIVLNEDKVENDSFIHEKKDNISEKKPVTKKRYKLKKSVLKVFILLIIVMIIIIIINAYYKHINSSSYLLKEKGYTENEVVSILKDKKMTDLLLKRDYNKYIIDIVSAKYYLSKNLDKYLDYKKENNDKSTDDVIAIINVNANKKWYDDPKPTDITKNNLILVNKFNYLEENYVVDDLVDMSILYAFNGKQIKKEAYDAFVSMCNSASKEELKLVGNSAYRTYLYQKNIYTSYKSSKGLEEADKYAARAGYSEHQTGLAIDISTLKSNADNFDETKEFSWLISNAYKYGFILRYPLDKEYLTGYNYESWHYRYVGVDAAKIIHDEKITFDEYYAYYVDGE